MAGFFNALSACLVLLMLMAVGYFMGARGWMTTREKGFVSKYIINIAVPCNCIVGLLDNLDRSSLMQAGGMVATAILSVWLAFPIRCLSESLSVHSCLVRRVCHILCSITSATPL